MPLIANQPLEQVLLERRAEPEQRNLILAHVRVNPKRHRRPRLAKPIEGRERHLHVIAHTADIDDDAAGMLLDERPTQLRDHFILPSLQPLVRRPSVTSHFAPSAVSLQPSDFQLSPGSQ